MKQIVSRAVALAALCLSVAAPAGAAMLTLGTPTTATPAALVDPLGTLPPVLGPGLYLLPVEAIGAADLQTFGFSLGFDPDVVTPHDAGGLFQSVYAALFSDLDPVPTEITSAGFALPGLLEGVSGFASGVDGDGTLAFVLFALAPGANIDDAGFRLDVPDDRQLPEPATWSLAALPLLALARRRRRAGAALAWVMATACGSAAAQLSITANGPYYATPSWDQTIVSGRFVVLSNFRGEAVLDRETGLVWERAPGSAAETLTSAQFLCAAREIGGRLGWRLPTIDELSSLVDTAAPAPGPKLPPGHPFVLPAATAYWSSSMLSPLANPQFGGLALFLNGGFVGNVQTTSLHPSWCVRGGSR